MKALLKILLGIVIVAALYFLMWPVPLDPVAWTPGENAGLTGVYAENDELSDAERIDVDGVGPEDITMGPDGMLYTGLVDGRILQFDPDELAVHTEYANTGGRPLGMDFDAEGNLIVADAHRGLLSVAPDGEVTVLVSEIEGVPMMVPDDLDIADDGTVWFSDASQRFPVEQFFDDFWEGRATGRLISYDPVSKEATVRLEGLHFANGVALGPNEDYVLVAETPAARITRLWLKGDKAGTTDVFVDGMAGYPDNLSYSDGVFWVALPSTRLPMLEKYAEQPFVRKVLARLPLETPPLPAVGWVVGLDTDGNVVYNLQDWSGKYVTITSVNEFNGILYLGSFITPAFATIYGP